jgi:TRAP-type C4-dicarboxylate transport system permease small subunit
MHLALDLLVLKLKGRQKNVLNIIIHSLIALFSAGVLVYGGIQLVILTWVLDQSSPALGISMSFVYLVLPVSGLAIIIYAIEFILQEAGIRDDGMDAEAIHPGRRTDEIHAE